MNELCILVTGGRDYNDRERVYRYLDTLLAELDRKRTEVVLVQGGARGADGLAAAWGEDRGVNVITVKADWKAHGRGAGPRRNQLMLDEHKPHVVVAFPGGRGTADMVSRAHRANVPVLHVKEREE